MNQDQQQKAQLLGLIPAEMHSKRVVYLGLSILAVFVALLLWWWLLPKETPLLYKTAPLTRMDLSLTVSATGSITPKDQVEVSSELSGIIKEVFVDFNDKVKAGQKLAQLDTSKIDATVLQRKGTLRSANAQVSSARANLEEAKLSYQYYQEVWDSSAGKHPSKQVMDNARVTVAKAKATLEQALANVDNAKAELDYTQTDLIKSTIFSPIDGVVLSRAVEPGQTVASSFSAPTLFLLARDLMAMELIVAVDEADIGVIEEGQKASFTVDAYRGRTFNAEVTQIRLANIANSSTASTSTVVSYATVLKVDNQEGLLLPSMTAVTDIAVAEAKDTLAIENAALRYQPDSAARKPNSSAGVMGALLPRMRRDNDKKAGEESSISALMHARDATIWVLRNNQAVAVPVKIGISNGVYTQLIQGDIAEGEQIISDAVKVSK